MANIFNLTEAWKQIVDMADQLDEQTLEDTLESIEGETGDKVANMIAVVKNIKSEIDLAKDFKKTVEDKIRTMENTVARINDYILLGVDTVGKPKKGAEQFKKLEISGAPWVKSAWTQFNPPKVEIVDDRLVDPEFLIPQPHKVDTKEIAKRWKEENESFEAKRNAYMLDLQVSINEGEITEEEADQRLEQFDQHHKPDLSGVKVTQSVGIRYR
jgi:hypothetical protein